MLSWACGIETYRLREPWPCHGLLEAFPLQPLVEAEDVDATGLVVRASRGMSHSHEEGVVDV